MISIKLTVSSRESGPVKPCRWAIWLPGMSSRCVKVEAGARSAPPRPTGKEEGSMEPKQKVNDRAIMKSQDCDSVKICAECKHLLPPIYHPKDINQLFIKFWYHCLDAGLLIHHSGKGLSDEPILSTSTLMTDSTCENSFFTAGMSKTARFHTRNRWHCLVPPVVITAVCGGESQQSRVVTARQKPRPRGCSQLAARSDTVGPCALTGEQAPDCCCDMSKMFHLLNHAGPKAVRVEWLCNLVITSRCCSTGTGRGGKNCLGVKMLLGEGLTEMESPQSDASIPPLPYVTGRSGEAPGCISIKV